MVILVGFWEIKYIKIFTTYINRMQWDIFRSTPRSSRSRSNDWKHSRIDCDIGLMTPLTKYSSQMLPKTPFKLQINLWNIPLSNYFELFRNSFNALKKFTCVLVFEKWRKMCTKSQTTRKALKYFILLS